MGKLKALVGETVLYGLGSIVPRMLNFLLVPLHTIDMFDRSEYGQITKVYAFVAVINVVYMMGMETAFFRFATKPNADVQRVFRLAQTCVLFVSVVLSVFFICFSSSITNWVGIAHHPEYIIYLAITMLVDAGVAIPFAQLRLQKKAKLFAFSKIINVFILIALNYYFLKINYTSSVGIGYVFLANLIANSFYILLFFKTLIAWRPAWDKKISVEMIQYAYPVMITGVAGLMNEMFSRIMLDKWLPENFYQNTTREEAVGIFGACYKFAVFMNLGIQAFRYAAEPFFFSNAVEKNSPALFSKVNHYFIIVCCLVLLTVSINLDIIKYLIGESFWEGLPIIPVLLLAYLFLGIYYNISAWFKLTDKTQYGTFITIAGLLVTVLSNYFLISVAGYMGSSVAAVLCYLLMAVLCYILGQKYYPVPYRVGAGLTYIIFTFVLVYMINAIPFKSQWIATLFHFLVIGVYVLVVYRIERIELNF